MTEKIDVTITVPLTEFVKVLKMIYAFGSLLEDIDASVSDADLVEVCNRANLHYGDELDMLERIPLATEFSEVYYGVEK
jgi:hypothetical protein